MFPLQDHYMVYMYRPKTASLWAIFFEFSIKNQFPAQSFQTPCPLYPRPLYTASTPSTFDSALLSPYPRPLSYGPF